MKYDIYFHNDFDGRASAAMVLAFLHSRGDEIGNYIPVDFDLEPQWLKEDFFKKHKLFRGARNPAIIVDFLFHPGAAMWFDHHPTSIKKAAWKKAYKKGKAHFWDSSYPSCTHWVYDALRNEFGWKPAAHLKELAKWLDVIDGAQYRSAKQALEIKEPALQVDAFIETVNGDPKLAAWLIGQLATKPLSAVARLPKLKKVIKGYKKEIAKSLAFYRKHLQIEEKIGFIDLTDTKRKRLLFAPFYLVPDLRYGMRLTRKGKWFHISAGENPWKKTGKLDIGTIMAKYGGGGHETVGGVELYDAGAALRTVNEIAKKLNTKG